MSTPVDKAEDINDPEVWARHIAFLRKRGYPRDTYHLQDGDGCANCRHVFERRSCEGDAGLYCTYNAPPCTSVPMGEHGDRKIGKPVAYESWDEWKFGRDVMPQGICMFFEAAQR